MRDRGSSVKRRKTGLYSREALIRFEQLHLEQYSVGFANKDKSGLQLMCGRILITNFNTGISSLNVNYNMEIGLPMLILQIPIEKFFLLVLIFQKHFTQGEFNDYLLSQLQLNPEQVIAEDKRLLRSSLAARTFNFKCFEFYSNAFCYYTAKSYVPPCVWHLLYSWRKH